MAKNTQATDRIERLQVETTVGQYFFQDLYNKDVYFEDFDDKSSNYFKLDFDTSFNFTGGKNFIGIRGTASTMLLNSEILVEVVDANGQLLKSQVYGLGDDLDTKVISIDVTTNTPPGDTIVTIIGVASQAPDGTAIPPAWQAIPNFRWTRIFTCKPNNSNKSPVLYGQASRPVIKISEILKPFYQLTHNQDLSGSSPSNYWNGNPTSSYVLSSDGYASEVEGPNTTTKVEYKKSGGKFFVTAKPQGTSFIDFGGFTSDMKGGVLIVRSPQTPRPGSYLGYTNEHSPSNPIFAPEEEGDGLFENSAYTNNVGAFATGAYVSIVEEVISPFEIRTSSPHTTIQGSGAQYQNFEHFEFTDSDFELIWAQAPASYSANPTGSNGEPLNTSYAHVTFNNLQPMTGDVTRVKCYMKNEQAPFDWVLASDNAVEAQELLYRKDFQKYRAPMGDFTKQGVAFNGAASLNTYWTASGVGTDAPSLGIYQQQTAAENPPVQDCVVIGDNQQALNLDGTAYWVFEPSSSQTASFYQDQWYELSFKSVSQKTQIPSWTSTYNNAIEEPKLSLYMSGSAFTDGGSAHGKFIGLIEDTAIKKKQVDYDYENNEREIGKKFIFKADGTEGGAPRFKVDSGVWYLWDISIKPWDRKGFTPGTWDVIFPTIKCNVNEYDSLDFKFEFYNDYGDIADYTAVIPNVPWKNELTATFTNLVTYTVTATGPVSWAGPSTFGGTSSFTGPVTLSGPNQIGGTSSFTGPVTMSGPGLFGNSCNDTWIISGSVYLPCLPDASQSKILNWHPATGEVKSISAADFATSTVGAATQDLWHKIQADSTFTTPNSPTDTLSIVGGTGITTAISGDTLTITNGASSGAPDQDLFASIAITHSGVTPHAAQTTQTADTTTDTFTFIGGANVTLSSAADQMTIDVGTTPGAADQNIYESFAVAGQTTQTANAVNDTMTFVGTGGMTITTATDQITFHSSDNDSLNFFKQVSALNEAGSLQGTQLIASTNDTLNLKAGTNITLSGDATSDTVTISTTTAGSGGGSADNLGNHTATAALQMGNFWITQSDGYGHMWKGTQFSDYAEISRTAVDDFVIRNKGSKNNAIKISDGDSGIRLQPDNLTMAASNLSTHGGMQIKANNDFYYYSLKNADTEYTVKYNKDTNELTYFRENINTGGAAACMSSGPLNKSSAGKVGTNWQHGAANGNAVDNFTYISCTTTIGPPLYNPYTITGQYASWNSYSDINDETAWLMVNGFNSMDCPDGAAHFNNDSGGGEHGVKYAAIFNKMADPNLLGSDNFACYMAGAGHGIKIGVSSLPRTIATKGGGNTAYSNGIAPFDSCAEGKTAPNFQHANAQSGIPAQTPCGIGNVYYLSLYHKDVSLAPARLEEFFAGGIRKHHYNYKTQTILETVSDGRLKENIDDTILSIDILNKIPVRDFEWINQPRSEGGIRVSGFIAQEVAPMFPDAVVGNEEENPDPNDHPITMDYEAFIPLLVKSVQDQQKLIEKLTKRIEILENK